MKRTTQHLSSAVMFTLIIAVLWTLAACGGGGSPGGTASSTATTTTGAAPVLTTGTVTGFGSIFIDGVEFQTDATTRRRRLDQGKVDLAGDDKSIFSLGMVVSVQHRQGSNKASKIEFINNLLGPASNVTATGCTVMGVPVLIGPFTVIKPDITALVNGVIAEVSGLPNLNGAIPATFIEVHQAGVGNALQQFELKGFISGFDPVGKTFSLGPVFNSTNTVAVSFANAVIDNNITSGLADGLFVEVKTDLAGSQANPINALKIELGIKAEIEVELEH